MTPNECFNCGSTDNLERTGGVALCADCIDSLDGESPNDDTSSDGCAHDEHTHEPGVCRADVADDEAAERLRQAIDTLVGAGADGNRLRLLPKDSADQKGLAHFELGEGALDADEVRYYEYTPEEAIEAVRHGHPGFAVYYGMERYGTGDVLAIDVDERDTFPYDDVPTTAMFTSGSGRGDHLIYTNDGSVDNAAADDPVDGEVRANRLYTVLPGSTHDSGGMYGIAELQEPATLSEDDLPDELTPNSNWSQGENESVRLNPPEDVEDASDAEFTNDEGVSLEQIREWDDYLDDLCAYLDPPGHGHDDTSKFDFHFVRQLTYWRFSRGTIERIWRRYRYREKLRTHSTYVERTIQNAQSTVGEQYNPSDPSEPEGPLAILPVARLDALSHQERRRYARKRDIDWPDVSEVRDRLHEAIEDAVAKGEEVVISSPTGSGKSHTVATEPWMVSEANPGEQPTIHAHPTHEARDDARQMSEKEGVDAFSLKGRKELCPVCAGHHDPEYDEDGNIVNDDAVTIEGRPVSEWIDHRCDRQGLPISVVHTWAEQEYDGTLPCEEGNTDCPVKGQFDKVPRNDDGDCEYDVIHCTHQFLLVPSMRMHTNIFLDEKPSFNDNLDPELVRRSVNGYLEYADAPVDSYNELVHAVEHGQPPEIDDRNNYNGLTRSEFADTFREQMDAALAFTPETADCPNCGGEGELDIAGADSTDLADYDESIGTERNPTCQRCDGDGVIYTKPGKPKVTWYRENPNVHALAPALTRAIWNAEEGPDGRKHSRIPYRPPRFGEGDRDEAGWNRIYVDVVLDHQWEVEEAAAMPDFSLSDSLVGLDAHPQDEDPKWGAEVKPGIQTNYVLSRKERTLYRRYERGLFTVQVGEGVQPVTSGKWWDEGQGDKFRAIIEQMRDHHGEDFRTAITSKALKPKVRRAMKDAGVEDPELMHFGAEESRNDFAGEDVGLVIGSIDPGDRQVVNTLARQGLDAEPCYHACPECDGAGTVDDEGTELCETCSGEGRVREHGRTFEGPDADKARDVLRSVREHHVAQSAGRWARQADDPDDNATVYVVTEAAPDGFIDAQTPGVTWTTNPDQRDRLEYVSQSADGVTSIELAEEFDITRQTGWRTLEKARKEGLLERNPGKGANAPNIYYPNDEFHPAGSVDLSPDSSSPVTDDVLDYYTYSVTANATPNCAYNSSREEGRGTPHQTALDWYDRLPAPPG